jgi:acetoin utilization protein AcuB
VTTLPDDARLLDAALMIRRTGKRHVPVVSSTDGKVVGIISDRDVLRLSPSVLSENSEEEYNKVFESTPIVMGMTRNPISISVDAPMSEAVQLLYSKRVNALLVMDGTDLKGIVTTTDMLGILLEMLSDSDKSSSMSVV